MVDVTRGNVRPLCPPTSIRLISRLGWFLIVVLYPRMSLCHYVTLKSYLVLFDSRDGLAVVGAVSICGRRDPRSGESRAVRTGRCGTIVPFGARLPG